MVTIVWDVDDVLNDLTLYWFKSEWLNVHPGSAVQFDDITENPPHRILGMTKNDYLLSLDNFRLSNYAEGLLPNPDVLDWFQRFGEHYRHIALTAAPIQTAHISAQWVIRHFGQWIRTFHFIPSHRNMQRLVEYDGSKADYLRWLGKADIIVDDNEANIQGAEEAGITGILMPCPWNKGKSGMTETLKFLTETAESISYKKQL